VGEIQANRTTNLSVPIRLKLPDRVTKRGHNVDAIIRIAVDPVAKKLSSAACWCVASELTYRKSRSYHRSTIRIHATAT
jgi:hypothetical protein